MSKLSNFLKPKKTIQCTTGQMVVIRDGHATVHMPYLTSDLFEQRNGFRHENDVYEVHPIDDDRFVIETPTVAGCFAINVESESAKVVVHFPVGIWFNEDNEPVGFWVPDFLLDYINGVSDLTPEELREKAFHYIDQHLYVIYDNIDPNPSVTINIRGGYKGDGYIRFLAGDIDNIQTQQKSEMIAPQEPLTSILTISEASEFFGYFIVSRLKEKGYQIDIDQNKTFSGQVLNVQTSNSTQKTKSFFNAQESRSTDRRLSEVARARLSEAAEGLENSK